MEAETQGSALEVMESLRRRWIDELSNAVRSNEEHLKRAVPKNGDPFACDGRLAVLAEQIVELQSLIDAMGQNEAQGTGRQKTGAPWRRTAEPQSNSLFDRFVSCIVEQRHEDAVRELAKIIPLQAERLATAVYYFARALRVHRDLGEQLNDLYRRLDQLSDAEATKIFFRTLGFQAIEAGFAVETLRRAYHTQIDQPRERAARPEGPSTQS